MVGTDADTGAPVWRCLAVWGLTTSAALTAVVLGADAAGGLPLASTGAFDQAVVALAGAVAVLVCPWLWLLTTWGVVDALRGRAVPTGPGWWRRATMLACGCAAGVAVALPAHAQEASGDPAPLGGTATAGVRSTQLLDGLPYPERPARPGPTTPATSTSRTVPAATTSADHHLVRPGDTLWSVTSTHLADGSTLPTAADVARAVARLHDANRPVVGDDPDLILPGQRLTLDPIRSTHREDPR